MSNPMTRRRFLSRSLVGCSLAASPLITPVTLAAAPWDTRLVVIILRGGMDALDVVQPYGDPGFAAARRTLGGGPGAGAHDLNGFFALHPALGDLMPLWQRGELGFVQAVATPYRDKRSHFDGQDLLEAGTGALGEARDGWLNRMLAQVPGVQADTAYAIGHGELKVLLGDAPVADWSPDADLLMSPQAERLAELMMQDDPMFHAALMEALDLSRGGGEGAEMADMDADMQMALPRRGRKGAHRAVAEFAAKRLRGEARVAAFSINGWDTHNRQERALPQALAQLGETILTLKEELRGPVWGKTAVIAMTEFGRTVRENGTRGTDHGTGGAMVLAGGAIRGGRVHGRWPGLAEADLYDRRDLMPTSDVRAHAGWIMAGLTGLDPRIIERAVFPGVELGTDPGLLR